MRHRRLRRTNDSATPQAVTVFADVPARTSSAPTASKASYAACIASWPRNTDAPSRSTRAEYAGRRRRRATYTEPAAPVRTSSSAEAARSRPRMFAARPERCRSRAQDSGGGREIRRAKPQTRLRIESRPVRRHQCVCGSQVVRTLWGKASVVSVFFGRRQCRRLIQRALGGADDGSAHVVLSIQAPAVRLPSRTLLMVACDDWGHCGPPRRQSRPRSRHRSPFGGTGR